MTRHPYRTSGSGSSTSGHAVASLVADIVRAAVMLTIAGALVEAVKRISALDPLAVVRML